MQASRCTWNGETVMRSRHASWLLAAWPLLGHIGGSPSLPGELMLRNELEEHIPHLRRYARALARNRDVADDLVQETLLRALDAELRWRGGNLRVWLFTILTNLNRNRLRSLVRRAPHDGIEAIDAAHPTPSTNGESRDITRALESISTEQREVLLLVALEGLSYADCARALAVPVGTVMSRLSRARAAFRNALDTGKPAGAHLRVVK